MNDSQIQYMEVFMKIKYIIGIVLGILVAFVPLCSFLYNIFFLKIRLFQISEQFSTVAIAYVIGVILAIVCLYTGAKNEKKRPQTEITK